MSAPSGWETRPLWSCFRRKKVLGSGDETLLSVYRDYGVIPKDSRDDNHNRASEDLSKYQLVSPGDLVVNKMKAWQGSVAISRHSGLVSPAYYVFEPIHAMSSEYLHYLLRSREYFAQYAASSFGVRPAQWDLSIDYFRKIDILMPSFSTQKAIADFLDRETAEIDAFVAESEKLITLLNERRAAVITQAVTKGLDPSAPMKDTGIEWLGQIPAHWRVYSLRHLVARIEQGVSPEAEGGLAVMPGQVGVLKAGCVNWGWFNAEEHKLLPSSFEFAVEHLVQPGDLLVNRASGSLALLGSAALVSENPFELILSDKTFRLRAGSLATETYLYWLLNSRVYREQVEVGVSGADGLANNLPMSRLRAIRLPVPSLLEQTRIVEYLQERTAKINEAIETAREAIALAKERRQALISAAVTGKIDVRSAA